jgi:hypothetical protein
LAIVDSGHIVSTILNLTDSILGESLGIQIIATFNSNLHNIDRVLLRKGQMLALYEFEPLHVYNSASLLSELGVDDVVVKSPMTLADIYNFNEQESSYKVQGPVSGLEIEL